MDDREARATLSTHREGEQPLDGPRLQQALQKAEADPELARWWSEEQELDRIIAAKLASTHVAAGLKAKITSSVEAPPRLRRSNWSRVLLLGAASIVAIGVLFSSWRGPFQPAASLADYREEMVSFVKVPPTLELETPELTSVTDFLKKANAPAQFAVPKKLQAYDTAGCRVLRFRGRDVSLVCFKIGGDKLAHLFVMDAKALSSSGRTKTPVFAPEGSWMTATWIEDGRAYLLTVKGDQPSLEKVLGTS